MAIQLKMRMVPTGGTYPCPMEATWDQLKSLAVDGREWSRGEAKSQRESDRKASMCDGKAKHATERDAHSQARRTSAYMNIYECEYCQSWHIGKPTRR